MKNIDYSEYEAYFKDWLDRHEIMHIPFEQSMESYSKAFKKMEVKRPDFLILLKHLGMISVDVKARTITEKYNNFFLEKQDVYLLSRFQEVSCMPVWIAMIPINSPIKNLWYWINIAEIKRQSLNQNQLGEGYYIKLENCIEVKLSEGISQILQFD